MLALLGPTTRRLCNLGQDVVLICFSAGLFVGQNRGLEQKTPTGWGIVAGGRQWQGYGVSSLVFSA